MQVTYLGRTLRDSQIGLFERREQAFLMQCRALAVAIARQQGSVSINDIRSQVSLPSEMHPSVLGAVFRSNAFRAVGFTEAVHPQAHARVVRVYALKE